MRLVLVLGVLVFVSCNNVENGRDPNKDAPGRSSDSKQDSNEPSKTSGHSFGPEIEDPDNSEVDYYDESHLEYLAALTVDQAVRVDQQFLREKHLVLSANERFSDEGKKLAREFLRKEYEALGFKVEEQKFEHTGRDYQTGETYTRDGFNLIATKKGKSDKFFVLGGHYDNVRDTMGANDNASGTITNLGVAKALADKDYNIGFRVVSFDFEEAGLIGSQYYARNLEKDKEADKLVAAYANDMTGYNHQGNWKFGVVDCPEREGESKNDSNLLSDLMLQSLGKLESRLKKVPACTDRSDHDSFWEIGAPAIHVGEQIFEKPGSQAVLYPCYHQPCDTIEAGYIDYEYMTAISSVIATSVAAILGESP